ncbi:SGNH/GDSL hydrolase family protein [Prevotella dentasini]|uniref:SGNH/GDSL hydrolase family protein n=1 Tax=Prevotella dentasini TaxID=589537 RepID=UPI00046AD061|nr:SGNH/GDSL hydrolase family protein [Prevotella dentasini]
MKKILFILFLTASAAAFGSTTLPVGGLVVSPADSNIQYIGRLSFRNPQRPMFNWPGVEIRSRFTGTSLKMIAKPKSGYFVCRIDHAEPFKVAFNSERDSVVSLATALRDTVHSVRIVYAIEGMSSKRHAEFHGFVLDDGHSLVAPEPLPDRRIEFIGNSITCGYGIESTRGTDKYEDETENHDLTYAAQTSRRLNAVHTAVARSGIGVYRNYNGPKTGNKDVMATEYGNTVFGDSTEHWDFSRWTPQVVCINLGTNDFSTHNYDADLYKAAYRKFLQTVRSHYPSAKIVMLCGPMLHEKEEALQWTVLVALMSEFAKQGDNDIHPFSFSRQTGELGYGASYHPSYRQHTRMADELTPFLQKLMGW